IVKFIRVESFHVLFLRDVSIVKKRYIYIRNESKFVCLFSSKICKADERGHNMSEYQSMARRQRKWMYILIGIIVVLAVFLPEKQIMYGLLLGLVVGFYNLWLLQRKANVQGEEAAKNGKRKGVGTISRLASAALGTLIAIRYDWSIVSFIIGLMAVYPVIMLDYIWFNRK